jgi:hypothetical protein
MQDYSMIKEARLANVAVVVALDAVQNGRWAEAERALSEVVLLTAHLRREINARHLNQPVVSRPAPRMQLAMAAPQSRPHIISARN